MDETAIEATTGRFRVVVPKDCRVVVRKDIPHFNHHMTLIMCASANGDAMRRPTVILPLESLPDLEDSTIQRYSWSGSATGWITKEIWSLWIRDHFIPWVQERRSLLPASVTDKTAALFMDAHVSRLDEVAHRALEDNNIKAITIPAHSSQILQPLDCGVNNTLKSLLKKKAFTGKLRMDAGVAEYRSSVLKTTISALYAANNPDVIIDAFETTGIHPWNPSRVLDRENVLEDDTVPETPQKTALQNISGTIVTAELIRSHREQREAEAAAKEAARIEKLQEREAKRAEKAKKAEEKKAVAAEREKAKAEKAKSQPKKRKGVETASLTCSDSRPSSDPPPPAPAPKKRRKE